MALLILTAYDAEKTGSGISIKFLLRGDAPFPSRNIEVRNVSDCVTAFDAYKIAAAATGKPMALSMNIRRCDRSPPGFKKLKGSTGYETVNL